MRKQSYQDTRCGTDIRQRTTGSNSNKNRTIAHMCMKLFCVENWHSYLLAILKNAALHLRAYIKTRHRRCGQGDTTVVQTKQVTRLSTRDRLSAELTRYKAISQDGE